MWQTHLYLEQESQNIFSLYDKVEAIFLFRGSGDNLCQKKQTDHALNAPVKLRKNAHC